MDHDRHVLAVGRQLARDRQVALHVAEADGEIAGATVTVSVLGAGFQRHRREDDRLQFRLADATFTQTLGAVAWSFFGVRKSAEWEKDVGQLNPVHLIIAGLLAAVLFVVVLVLLVQWVIASGVAA